VADLTSALEGDDAESIAAKTQILMQASMKLGEAMYQSQAGAPGAEGAGPSAAADDGVVDAEFEDVSGDKK
jgi:molecular chaperone DnaK